MMPVWRQEQQTQDEKFPWAELNMCACVCVYVHANDSTTELFTVEYSSLITLLVLLQYKQIRGI